MSKHLIILISFFSTSVLSFSQIHLNSTYTNFVFVDSTNVRENPSITSKILGKVAHNSAVTVCESLNAVEGQVGNVKDSWQPINFNETVGYIWRPNFADGVFKSELDPDVTFLINFTAGKGIEFKAFRQKELVYSQLFEDKEPSEIYGSVSLGTITKSNGNEIIAIQYDSIFKLFEWNGSSLKTTDVILNDASLITSEYIEFDTGFINSNKVNLRSAPHKNAAILETVDLYTAIKMSGEKRIRDTINGNPGFWYSVQQSGKTAYVWSDFFDAPERYVKSNKVDGEAFLYTAKAIYVLQDGKVVYRFGVDDRFYHDGDDTDEMYKNDFIQFGTMGLKSSYEFLGVCYGAFSCGEAGGDRLYLWDGTKMVYFANDYGIGDGGYSTGHYYTFPIEEGGIKNKIILEETDDYYENSNSDCFESSSGVFTYARYEFEFNGDTLVELKSRDSDLRAFLRDSLPGFQLFQYKFSDLNNDGIQDAAFYMEVSTDSISDTFSAPLIGIAYGTSAGSYDDLKVNRSLIQKDYYSIGLNTKNDTLEIRVNYFLEDGFGYSNDSDVLKPMYSQFSFVHDTTYNKLVWYAKTEAEDADLENTEVIWKITNKERFKKNKVAFENAWEKKRFD